MNDDIAGKRVVWAHEFGDVYALNFYLKMFSEMLKRNLAEMLPRPPHRQENSNLTALIRTWDLCKSNGFIDNISFVSNSAHLLRVSAFSIF